MKQRWLFLVTLAVFAAADSQMVTFAVVNPDRPTFGPDTLFVATWGVNPGIRNQRNAPYRTIQAAVDSAAYGDVVCVLPGVYNEAVQMWQYGVELRSDLGPEVTIINGSGKGTPVEFWGGEGRKSATPEQEGESVLDGFTITCPSCEEVTREGGGIRISYQSPIIKNNRIVNNRLDLSESGGGGISVDDGNPTIYGNRIENNQAAWGGGINVGGNSAPIIYNNIIAGNVAASGAGIYVYSTYSPFICNNTIANNSNTSAGGGAGVHIGYDGTANIVNSIIALNTNGFGIYAGSPNFQSTVSYSLIYGNSQGRFGGDTASIVKGPGMLYSSPGFADAAARDYRLICGSPAIDHGDSAAIDALTDIDLAGMPRIIHHGPDMGALEFFDANKNADFVSSTAPGCDSLTVSFINGSTCVDEAWLWHFGDGTSSTVKNPTHHYAAPGTYDVTLQAIGEYDSDTLIRADYVRVFADVAADFTADTTHGCIPLTVTFASTAMDSVFSYEWDFGDGGTAQEPSPSHEYDSAGIYTVQLIASNPCGPNTTSKSQYVTALLCPEGSETLFVATWGVDAGGRGSRALPLRTIQAAVDNAFTGNIICVLPGTYHEAVEIPSWIIIELRSEKGPDSTTIDGSGLGIPVTFLGGQGQGKSASPDQQNESKLDGFTVTCSSCTGLSSAGGIRILGRSPTIRNNRIVNNRFGIVGGKSGGGIYIYDGDPTICGNWIEDNQANEGGGIYVGWSSAPVIYNNMIARNTAAAGGGIFAYSTPGPFIYNNTIVGNSDTAAAQGAGVHVDYDGSAKIINNIIALNTNGFGIYGEPLDHLPTVSYSLLYGNSNGHTGGNVTVGSGMVHASPAFVNATAGDYRLTCGSPAFDKGDSWTIDTLTKIDLVGKPRIIYGGLDLGALEFFDGDKHADFVASATSGCNSLSVSFTNTSTCIDEQWSWSFGDGSNSSVKNPTHYYAAPGRYTVTLRAIGDYDSDTLIRTDHIRVYKNVAADFTADTTFGCVPLTVTFSATAQDSVFSYAWSFGDGGTGQGPSPSHEYKTAGLHTVWLIASNPCGPDTVTRTAYIHAERRPEVQITSSYDTLGSGCSPYLVRFHVVAAESLKSFSWDLGDNSFSTERDPAHVYAKGGTYSVQVIAVGVCGTDTASRSRYVTVLSRPTAMPHANLTQGCAPFEVKFTADTTGPIQTFQWYFGDGGASTARTPSHTYASPGRYGVRLVYTHQCGADSVVLADSIIVRAKPTVAFSCPSAPGYAPYDAHFTDNSTNQPATWSWEFGDGGTSNLANPTHTYAHAGRYSVALTASNACGSGTRLEKPQCVAVGGYELQVGSPTQSGDTTVYPILVDTAFAVYPNSVQLSAVVAPVPYRGSLSATFTNPTWVPRFTTSLNLVPSGDLPSGTYKITVTASDAILGYDDDTTLTYTHVGQTMLSVFPNTVNFDSVETGKQVTRQAFVVNIAPAGSGYPLAIQAARIDGKGFSLHGFSPATILPDSVHPITVRFLPIDRVTYHGVLRITTNDPVVRDTVVFLVGRGIPEQTAPRVTATTPPCHQADVLINSPIVFEFSEPMRVESTDTTVTVRSWRLGQRMPGHLVIDGRSVRFTGEEFWPTYDSLFVRLVADRVTDTVYNRVDGDGDGLEEGSPVDDYQCVFVTGPGVYPGDADDNRTVDERDVLPIGRFWDREGPQRPLEHQSFTIQPAHEWPDSAATYADADGNGRIDSLDVCPILEFWSSVAEAPLAKEQAFLQDLAAVDASILRAMYNAIDFCPAQQKAAELKGILAGWMEQKGGMPSRFELSQNFPNPFNARTVITFTLPALAEVELVIFNPLGEQIAVLAEGQRGAGRHVAIWDGRTSAGEEVASGVYFCRLKAGHLLQTRKMTLLK